MGLEINCKFFKTFRVIQKKKEKKNVSEISKSKQSRKFNNSRSFIKMSQKQIR